MYEVDSHVLMPKDRQPKEIYVCLLDTKPVSMDNFYKFLAETLLPEGTEQGVTASGMSGRSVSA